MAEPSVSQSVARMVGILEVFARERRPLTTIDLIEAMDAPRSSLAALLREMVDLSVLALDRRSATYLPTAHFGRLASWLSEAMVQDPRVFEAAEQLQRDTEETVTLAVPSDRCMEVFHVVRGNQAISFIAEPGQQITMWGSALGTAWLATLSNANIISLYQRGQRSGGDLAPRVLLEEVQAHVTHVRSTGCARAFGAVFPDASAMSVVLPESVGIRRCVLSVAGPTERIRRAAEGIEKRLHEVATLLG